MVLPVVHPGKGLMSFPYTGSWSPVRPWASLNTPSTTVPGPRAWIAATQACSVAPALPLD